MADPTGGGTPVGGLVQFGRKFIPAVFGSSDAPKAAKRFRERIESSTDPDALLKERDQWDKVAKSFKSGRVQKAAQATADLINARLLQLEGQGITPEGDYLEPPPEPDDIEFPEDSFEPVDFSPPLPADVPLSPVLAAPVLGGIINTQAIRDAALKAIYNLEQAAKKRQFEQRTEKGVKKLLKKQKPPSVAAYGAKKLLEIAAAQYPSATKVIRQGVKMLKKVKPAQIGRVGGLAGIAISVGGQFGIEKISEAVAKRQFAEMERILKRGQAASDKAVKAVRARKALPKAATPPKPPAKTPPRRAEPPRPKAAPAPQVAPPQAVKTLENAEKARAKPTTAAGKVLKPGPMQTPKTAGATLKRILSGALQTAPILALLRSSRSSQRASSITSLVPGPVPGLKPQPSPLRSSLIPSSLGGTITKDSCPCPKPRKKGKKKRNARICVKPSEAKEAGFLGKLQTVIKQRKS